MVTPDESVKEKVVVQTIVSLPHASPSINLSSSRKYTLVYTSSTSSQGGVKDSLEEIDLDEVIEIPKFDLDKLTLEQMQIMQNVLQRKTRQEQLRKERR